MLQRCYSLRNKIVTNGIDNRLGVSMKLKMFKQFLVCTMIATTVFSQSIVANASVLTDISVGSGAVMNQVTSYVKVAETKTQNVQPETEQSVPTLIPDVTGNTSDETEVINMSVVPSADTTKEARTVASLGLQVSEEESKKGLSEITGKVGAGELFESIELDDEEDEEELSSGSSFGYTNLGVADVSDHLNVRASAESDSKLVGKLGPNSGCEVLGVEGNMAHISSGSVEGYVSLDYLLTGDAAIQRASEVCTKLASVNADGLKLRKEPNTDCATAGMVAYGEELPVVDDTLDGWVAVTYDGETVYVCADYVSVDEKLKTALNMTEVLYGEGVNDVRVSLCEYAKQFLGNPYVWGGTSLTKGADCSGYVLSIFAKYGIYLPHSSRAQAQMGTKISLGEAKPGDLVFYAKGGRVNHVGIYIGGGQIINASSPKTGIRISNVYYRTPVAVRRILPN